MDVDTLATGTTVCTRWSRTPGSWLGADRGLAYVFPNDEVEDIELDTRILEIDASLGRARTYGPAT